MAKPQPIPPAPKPQGPLFNRGQRIYVEVRKLHQMVMKLMREAHEVLDSVEYSDASAADCVDLAHCLRQSGKFAEDLKKEFKGLEEELEKIVCMYIINDATNEEARIQTDYASATADISHSYVIPTFDKDPVGYEKLMTWLGIDPNLWDRGKELTDIGENATKVVDVHWPGLQYLVQRLKAAGHNPPEGLDPDRAYPKYKLGIRQRKPIA
jgi:hypothetical protein